MRTAVVALGLALLLGACTTSSRNTYSSQDIGTPIETTPGTVISSRVVEIEGEPGIVGPAAGGVAGGVLAGASIGSGSGSTIAAVLGGLIGAGVGYVAEQQAKGGEGIEYILRMEDGRTITLVENREPDQQPVPDGTPVLVQVGSRYSRILEHPDADGASGAGSDWVDPDALDRAAPVVGSDDPAGSAPPVAPPGQQQQ